jgi:hypothetical protein
MATYQTVDVTFDHCTCDGPTRRVNRAVITMYGTSEFAVLAELRRQYPHYHDIVILQCTVRG